MIVFSWVFHCDSFMGYIMRNPKLFSILNNFEMNWVGALDPEEEKTALR